MYLMWLLKLEIFKRFAMESQFVYMFEMVLG